MRVPGRGHVSGFVTAPGGGVRYELTRTKCAWWHRHRRGGCECSRAEHMVVNHVIPAGFAAQCRGNYWVVDGPGLAEGSTDALYRALAGF